MRLVDIERPGMFGVEDRDVGGRAGFQRAGVQVQDVNKLIKMHQEMERAMKQIKKMGGLKGLAAMFGGGGGLGGLGGGGAAGGVPGGGLPGGLGGMPGLGGGGAPDFMKFLKK